MCELLNSKVRGGRVTGADIADITSKAYLNAQRRVIATVNQMYHNKYYQPDQTVPAGIENETNTTNTSNTSNVNKGYDVELKKYVDSLSSSILQVQIQQSDLLEAVTVTKPSVSSEELRQYESQFALFGCDN